MEIVPVPGAVVPEFRPFPKLARLNRPVVVTEKIDGTNAIVYVNEDASAVRAGSRTRWISPGSDNFGFAAWVAEHAEELKKLGPGYHYGEWWGPGIQRGYGVPWRRYSLFNVSRWGEGGKETPPACCRVVPVLWKGQLDGLDLHAIARRLRERGSLAAPGFMDPEGFVAFFAASSTLHKFTLDGDGHKYLKEVAA